MYSSMVQHLQMLLGGSISDGLKTLDGLMYSLQMTSLYWATALVLVRSSMFSPVPRIIR